MSRHGYSLHVVHKNKAAHASHIGVKLGRYCIQNGLSADVVAGLFGVSTATVYNWFAGSHNPRSLHKVMILKFLGKAKPV